VESRLHTCFPLLTPLSILNGISIGSAAFAELTIGLSLWLARWWGIRGWATAETWQSAETLSAST